MHYPHTRALGGRTKPLCKRFLRPLVGDKSCATMRGRQRCGVRVLVAWDFWGFALFALPPNLTVTLNLIPSSSLGSNLDLAPPLVALI